MHFCVGKSSGVFAVNTDAECTSLQRVIPIAQTCVPQAVNVRGVRIDRVRPQAERSGAQEDIEVLMGTVA